MGKLSLGAMEKLLPYQQELKSNETHHVGSTIKKHLKGNAIDEKLVTMATIVKLGYHSIGKQMFV